MTRLLLVGHRADLDSLVTSVTDQFPDVRWDVRTGLRDAVACIEESSIDLVVFHWKHAGHRRAFDTLRDHLRVCSHKTQLVVVSEINSADVALHAMESGAIDCLCRPFSRTRLVFLVGALTARIVRQRDEPVAAANGIGDVPVFLQSAAMRNLMDSLRLAARSDSTILLMGETGTGKNRLASYTHQLSSRRHEPMVTVDCGASSETLIESELFGHVRGAFTGADRNHVGKLERAGGGTVLLDEINSLPMRCQSRLLRVLEEKLYEKVGDEQTRRFAGRVIALTNSRLERDVEERRFRKDLYYRLNVISFTVPPLRERSEDIGPLAKHFLQRLTARERRRVKISDEALAALTQHNWPGNVRELRNVLERALALCDTTLIEPRHFCLPAGTNGVPVHRGRNGASRLADARSEAERRELARVLEDSGNNRTRAAQYLGISRSALYKRLEKLGLT
jgi:DNA-binding NtrC family response regulator